LPIDGNRGSYGNLSGAWRVRSYSGDFDCHSQADAFSPVLRDPRSRALGLDNQLLLPLLEYRRSAPEFFRVLEAVIERKNGTF